MTWFWFYGAAVTLCRMLPSRCRRSTRSNPDQLEVVSVGPVMVTSSRYLVSSVCPISETEQCCSQHNRTRRSAHRALLRAPLLGPSNRTDPLSTQVDAALRPLIPLRTERPQGLFCSRGRWLLRVLELLLVLVALLSFRKNFALFTMCSRSSATGSESGRRPDEPGHAV